MKKPTVNKTNTIKAVQATIQQLKDKTWNNSHQNCHLCKLHCWFFHGRLFLPDCYRCPFSVFLKGGQITRSTRGCVSNDWYPTTGTTADNLKFPLAIDLLKIFVRKFKKIPANKFKEKTWSMKLSEPIYEAIDEYRFLNLK